MPFPFPPPQGEGGASAVTHVTTGSVTSSGSTSTFYDAGGNAKSAYTATIPVPNGATKIVSVVLQSTAANDFVYASPSGYANGAASICLALASPENSTNVGFEAGGALELGVGGIVLPTYVQSQTYDYAVSFI